MTIYEQWRWAMAGVDAKKAISQTRAAQLVGVKLRTWQSWEWGEYEPPPYLPLALAAILHGLPAWKGKK